MPNVYVEPHPKGRPEGSAINDYVVEDHADHVLKTFKTQHEAIDWAKENGHHSPGRAGPAPERQENPRPLAHPLARVETSFLSDRS